MIHWWLPGTAPCGAKIGERFTGKPVEVTCPACLTYVQRRMAGLTREEAMSDHDLR